MKIAVPTRNGVVDSHFGHCAYYTIFDVADNNQVVGVSTLASPEGCGCKSNIAFEMQQMGITLMLAGNIGQGAVNKLGSCGIDVIKGCEGNVETLVNNYLAGNIHDNPQVCNHHDCESHKQPTFKIDIKL